MINILILSFIVIGLWILLVNQIYGMTKGNYKAMMAIPREINNFGKKHLGYDMIFNGEAWKREVPFLYRLFISIFAISKFLIWPFGVEIDE